MKTILVDAWNTFVTQEGKNTEIQNLLESFPNKKIILTNANAEEKIKYGIIDMPYEVFSLEHNPNKTEPEYYKKMLEHYSLSATDVVYFEHNQDAAKSARSAGINTFWYDKDKKDLVALSEFLKTYV